MHSRLYTRVLNQHGWVRNASAFSTLYNDTGVAGIYIEADSRRIEAGVDIACKELQVGFCIFCFRAFPKTATALVTPAHFK